jgi:methylenetetrahydrofolate dehydrogenase (NADP+)/methenyltetrahydrofolate cyclohydrolase
MELLDGKKVAFELRQKIKEEVESFEKKPGLAVVIVGEDPASKVYVGMKHKACVELGFNSYQHKLDKEVTEKELLALIEKLNEDDNVHGILVQLPIPKHINKNKVIETIDPKKDVDGFHPKNIGKMFIGIDSLNPCTPTGCIKLLEDYKIEIAGKNAVVVGRSLIVGKPVADMLLSKNATVTVCHRLTKDLKFYLKNADIIVAAVGVPKLIKEDMIKDGAVIIDVGMNRTEEGLVGDVDFENVKDKCSHITPVPGGVGPMTIACLMENTLKAYKSQEKK